MILKRNRLKILALMVIIIIGVTGYIKLSPYKRLIYPSQSIKVENNLYYINATDELLYESNILTKEKYNLSKDKIDRLGIIVFNNAIYYINKNSNKLYCIELNSRDIKEIDNCNIIMPIQPFFRLGAHIYYYNKNNNLIRIDVEGNKEKIAIEKVINNGSKI